MVKRIKVRTLLLGGFITLLFVVLFARIFTLQIVQGNWWHEQGVKKWVKESVIPAERGTISDRNGDALAINAPAYTVVVSPKVIQANGLEDMIVDGLHQTLGKDVNELKEIINVKTKDPTTGIEGYAKSREVRNEGLKIDENKKAQIDKLNEQLKEALKGKKKGQETGLDTIKESKRYYPKGSLASHVLGYTDRQGNPVAGLEIYMNKELKGTPGYLKYESDTAGDKLPNSDGFYNPPVNGKNIKLTIDDTIQYYIEEAMKEAYDKYQPISMTVIAADPKTMEILGMANLPTFDPNTYWNYDPQNTFNYAVKATYEPGSTFKIVTLAAAVQEKLFKPGDTYKSGTIIVPGTKTPLHDINRSGWGNISYLKGVKKSSNVAFVKLGEMLGKERLLKYIADFGFGKKTGIDLPGEITTVIRLPGPVETATASYGHGVSVTPIQQLAAISAVANGGKLLKPQIIKEKYDPNTGNLEPYTPDAGHQVISPEAAKETSGYLEQVVADQKDGTGRNAYIDGYRVAGKTGTAVKYGKNKLPDYSKSVVSFIGFAPVNDPKISVIVIMDQPNDPTAGGGRVAAPVFKKIVSQSLQYMGVPKTTTKTESNNKNEKNEAVQAQTRQPAPDMVKKNVKDAEKQLLKSGIAFDTLGNGATVTKQFPAKGTPLNPGQRIYLLTETDKAMDIPDLTGASLRDALDVLTLIKAAVNVSGEGYVTSQKVTNRDGKVIVQLNLKPAYDPNGSDANTDGDGGGPEDTASTEDQKTDDSVSGKSSESSGKSSSGKSNSGKSSSGKSSSGKTNGKNNDH
ncbi:penicillin-binding transpeptidase domain-containing protein [Paenibacillus sp.]|jgi:penicillin-binding protein 2B|uniref:penicillin-binding transpeptidase domain-containing protein n=1 Tax=Paenibacillus sp. TaxID=58172 RepID=UPI0028282BC3|nr:penicillin-binding transpeptidase domain-containing protein [Paenibacillus sp.]MDR0268935.1 PASTA domain-containing protein [Paenibacillus sp.]